MKKIKFQKAFLIGVSAFAVIALAVGFWQKFASVSADTTTDLSLTNADYLTSPSFHANRMCDRAVNPKTESTVTAAELASLPDTNIIPKAWNVSIAANSAQIRLLVYAKQEDDGYVKYNARITLLSRSNGQTHWGGTGGETVVFAFVDGAGYGKNFDTLVKDQPLDFYVRRPYSERFLSILFYGEKRYDGCAREIIDIPQALRAQAALTPTPSVTPSFSVNLDVKPKSGSEDDLYTIRANVTDSSNALVGTNYAFWWNCDSSSTSIEETTQQCGQPRVNGKQYTQQQRDTGYKIENYFLTDKDGNKRTANSFAGKKYFSAGSRTIKVIVERNHQAVEKRQSINVAPGTDSAEPLD